MNDAVEKFLAEYPMTARWLNEIIDVMVERGGRSHVSVIARTLSKKHPDNVTEESTVTRTINDYCADAADFKRRGRKHNLFARVDKGTYRLLTYPEKPKLLEIVGIEFDDTAMQSVWKWWDVVRKKQPNLTNEQILTAFVNRWNGPKGKNLRELYDLYSQPLAS